MENLIIPFSVPPTVPVLSKQENPSGLSSKSANSTISFPKRAPPKITDAHLNYLCKNGRVVEAIRGLDSIAKLGLKVRPNTYINLLQSCIDLDSVQLGRKVHERIDVVKEIDSFVETKLVSMYAKCGCFDDARKVFDEMRGRNLYSWSAMIGACSREQRWGDVVELFFLMMEDGFMPDDFLLPKILKACGNCGDLETARLIHSVVIRSGLNCHLRVNNSILAVYAKCGELSSARKFFDNMDERDRVTWNAIILGYCQNVENEEAHRLFDLMCKEGIEPGLITWNILIAGYNQSGNCEVARDLMEKMERLGIAPDVFTWTSMISGLAQNNRRSQALDLFIDMLLSGVEPNGVTFTSAFSACGSLKSLSKGSELHSYAVKMAHIHDVLVGNSLIDMYSKCGKLEAAQSVFDMLSEKDVYTWNSMIGGYCQAGYCGKAYELFMKMQESDVRPNIITWNIMTSGYIQNGDEDQAMDLFHRMEKDGVIKRNTASWNSLIAGYQQNGDKNKALGIFRQMQSFRVSPNTVTMLSVLPACANLIASKKVKEIHGCVLRRNLVSELSVANSLIDTYAKSGNLVYSRTIFEQMSSKDVITWNSLIAGCILHGCADAALDLFSEMGKLGLKPNRGTLVSIIYAYSLAGMVDEGKQIFSSITTEHQIMPALEHYLAMIDVYGRSGRLEEAMEFIETMPTQPDFSVWVALLTACRIHGNIAIAAHAGERLLDSESGNLLIHRLIWQTYLLCGKALDALKLRKYEKENATKKSLGQSWMEAKNTVHTFITGDWSKLYTDLLYSWAQNVPGQQKVHDSHDELCIEEEEKEEIGGIHSEKLALAFALIGSSSVPQSIRIVKNIRMCGDCHRTAKHISATHGCEIYLSDSKCLHHFVNGHCSCRDYW